MIKKIFCLFLSFIVLLAATAACGKSETESNTSDLSSAVFAESDDISDPENAELKAENGENVSFEQITENHGLANGIDISKWQGAVDWKSVKAAGIDFAIIRIGFRGENGDIYKDSCADYNIQQAEKYGILTGVYFFSTAIDEAEAVEEAEWTLDNIKGYSVSYPIVYDCEGFNLKSSRMYGISIEKRTDNAIAFMDKIFAEGYEAMFYAAKNELEDSACWDTLRIENKYPIMIARYTSPAYPDTQTPGYAGKYAMWQYTNCGRVNGISGNCDLIVSYFTREKSTPKDKNKRPANAGIPQMNSEIYKPVSEKVTAKQETNLRDAAGIKSNVVATIKNGTFVNRTGIGSNGWSELEYNGMTVYAITSYLTTDISYHISEDTQTDLDGFTAAEGLVTAKEKTNLRNIPSVSGVLIATIRNGEFVTRTGISSKGWTRVEYNGTVAYAKTSLLTTEIIEKPKSPVEVSDDGFEAADDRVTAKIEVNLRTVPSSGSGSQVVYTLKNGELAVRTGINSTTGWSRLEYNGQTVYAVTSFLLTEAEYTINNQ